jgi:hypothetical protein
MISTKENARELLGLDKVNQVEYVAISVSSPDAIRSWSKGEVKTRRRLIIAHLSRKKAACSVNASSVL